MSHIQDMSDVMIAQLLHEQKTVIAPRRILTFAEQSIRQVTNVLVTYNGLRTSISGQVDSQAGATRRALQAARQQVDCGVAHIGLAVVYPRTLQYQSLTALKQSLQTSELLVATVTEAETSPFEQAYVTDLHHILADAFAKLTQEDVVAQATTLLDTGIEAFAKTIATQDSVVAQFSYQLGIPEQLAHRPSTSQLSHLTAEQRGAICRIGGLVLVNAMISQALLAKDDQRVTPLPQIISQKNLPQAFAAHWDFIVDTMRYYSLFHLATELIDGLPATPKLTGSLQKLGRIAQQIVEEQGLALRHDLMGRVYHRLLAEAKYLGIFYTTIPAATLLLKLALDIDQPWHDLAYLRRLKIADLSCGTGTLLMAAAEALGDNYISAASSAGCQPDSDSLHQSMLETMLHGYDVLPSAVHLTASSLALRMPRIHFDSMNLFSLPLGGHQHRLGSIEFLQGQEVEVPSDMFAPELKIRQISNDPDHEVMLAEMPSLDLCVINPPFTRSVGGNLLFGSVPEDERRVMQRKLKEIVRQPHVHANSTAGLGSIFVATADKHLKVGGRLALVLPKALISGVAWEATRRLLRRRYRVDYIITSQDPTRWNFSESTELSEILLVATKIADDEVGSAGLPHHTSSQTPLTHSPNIAPSEPPSMDKDGAMPALPLDMAALETMSALHRWHAKPPRRPDHGDEQVITVNLWRNPANSFEALALAFALTHHETIPTMNDAHGALSLTVGETKVGEAISLPWSKLKQRPAWMLPSAFAQADLIRVAYHLERGRLWLPGVGQVGDLPLRPLSDFGELGPDRRDIHDAFELSNKRTGYAAFWGQSAEVNTLGQQPNRYLKPVKKAKKGRPWRDPNKLWPRSGRLLLLERLRLNTQSVVAIRTPELVLSNMWWEFSYNGVLWSEEVEKALALWFNSTLGLLMLLAQRQETQGAWVAFKKPTLKALPVLDLHSLTAEQLEELAFAYDELADESLYPYPEMHIDLVRADIDQAIANTLDLPDFSPLRDMLAHEPVVCNRQMGSRVA